MNILRRWVENTPQMWYHTDIWGRIGVRPRKIFFGKAEKSMTIADVVKLLDAEILFGEDHLNT